MVPCGYPRSGEPLAPSLLREWLRASLPPEFCRPKAGLRTLCDLDQTAWLCFDPQQCARLAEIVVDAVAKAVRFNSPVGDVRLPSLPRGLAIADLRLLPRTTTVLDRLGVLADPERLGEYRIDDLLAVRGFWAKSLVDLLTALEAARLNLVLPATTVHGPLADSRFPRRGEALAPELLREVLRVRLPKRLVAGTRWAAKELCDLDASVWGSLSHECIEQLAACVVRRASACGRFPSVLCRRLPRLKAGVEAVELGLERRTLHCLQHEKLADSPEALAQRTIGQMLTLRGLGTKSLVDLLCALEAHSVRGQPPSAPLTAAAKAVLSLPAAAKVCSDDPRLGEAVRALDGDADTLKEICRRIVARRGDPPNPADVAERLRELARRLRRLEDCPLDEELLDVCAPDTDERDRQILAGYAGWDTGTPQTLEQLARRFGLSRERIRQVCLNALGRGASARAFAPVLDRVLRRFARRGPCPLGVLQDDLRKTGAPSQPLSVESVLRGAGMLGRKLPVTIVTVGRKQIAMPPGENRLPAGVVRAARKAVGNYGVGCMAEVLRRLAGRGQRRAAPKTIKEIMALLPDFHWLDGRRDWFRLPTQLQYGLPSLIDKVLSVAGALDVNAMHAALSRTRSAGARLPPAAVLREYCRWHPGVRVEASKIIADPPRDWRELLASVERGMVEILAEHGPVMERDRFESLCCERGMNPFSFNAIATSSPVITQPARGVFALLGTMVDERVLRRLRSGRAARREQRVLHSYGHGKDGCAYIAYRLSRATISGGVVTVPAAMKRRIAGRFAICTPEGCACGTLVTKNGCAWGLGPVLRTKKAREGDHLLLLVDPRRKRVEVHVGDEDVLKRTSS